MENAKTFKIFLRDDGKDDSRSYAVHCKVNLFFSLCLLFALLFVFLRDCLFKD